MKNRNQKDNTCRIEIKPVKTKKPILLKSLSLLLREAFQFLPLKVTASFFLQIQHPPQAPTGNYRMTGDKVVALRALGAQFFPPPFS